MSKFYVTFEIDKIDDDSSDLGDIADEFASAGTDWFAGSGQINKIEIQSISDTPPHNLREY